MFGMCLFTASFSDSVDISNLSLLFCELDDVEKLLVGFGSFNAIKLSTSYNTR